MGKPRMIILIRHAQSEGNKNREIHQTVPDHRVKLTPEGLRQAQEAGSNLRALLRPDDTIHFFTSPYRRTRETTEGILQSLTSDSPAPSPFPRHTIKVYEEPRLREQDFGNFQPCSAEMERMWLERADYGHFFYRIPNGESAADAYDRVSGFNESLWRLFGEDDFASVCVLVTHGLMTRVFLMKWYHWSVEYFEDLRNINHCEFVIMKLNPDNGKYVLQNQLRTWSDLRKEKEQEKQHERATKGLAPAHLTQSETSIPIRRKWGGCPDGCNHSTRRKNSLRSSRVHTADHPKHHHDSHPKKTTNDVNHGHPFQENHDGHSTPATETTTQAEPHMLRAPEPALGDRSSDTRPLEKTLSSPSQQYGFHGVQLDGATTTSTQATLSTLSTPDASNKSANSSKPPPPSTPSPIPSAIPRRPDLLNFHRDSEDHLLHPPRSNYAYIHLVGRDGGGSLSGANSLAPSEDEREDKPQPSTHSHPHYTHHAHIQTQAHVHTRPRSISNSHQSRPSQDLDNDGDDEGSGKPSARPRRTRSHNHHHRHLPTPGRRNLTKRVANILSNDNADQDGLEDEPEPLDPSASQQTDHDQFPEYDHLHDRHEHEHEHDHDHDEHEHEADYDHDHDHKSDEYEQSGTEIEDADLEAERCHDQSIEGSVY
ncbi:phosphoglycerate mutase-like protein [Aspergillus heteromorphus CBS 117.55]|uniref:Phosphoglycerate mutase-like protein n=1 Tax=Aspergillus heteromorphus CBS 117.55 TaxID=1448321 RepID=A0A317X201_9EURO|nr:phosphoglycerate mutase-like protein [Aspergillus heteromorphus CBS 117.55]PWY92596.1 phosphoglycerate mutase-like protein [Aspergillus heteromorphus CBS 117.55]